MNNIFSKSWFETLESQLREMGLDSDDGSFDEIKENLKNKKILSPDEFASSVSYVILAGGFKQKIAKICHRKLMSAIRNTTNRADLLQIFGNEKKIDAIIRVWNNRAKFCTKYYKCETQVEKLTYLKTLPHIGSITANHLARNLGEDMVKYDIWIQRLGVLYSQNQTLYNLINNARLEPAVQQVCDAMFDHMVSETNLPRGYIDVVLFRACQNGLIDVKAK